MNTALEAIERLQEGNRRFVSEVRSRDPGLDQARRKELLAGQKPFAIVLGCSDSRVPAELIFDQGLGDLFVVRVAGNIVAPSQAGSMELAAKEFGIRLLVVLGHSQCGAILATLEEMKHPTENLSPNLCSVTDRIRPIVEGVRGEGIELGPEALVSRVVRANIRNSVRYLREDSQILRQLIRDEGLVVVGAEYSLETGVVEFFDGRPGID